MFTRLDTAIRQYPERVGISCLIIAYAIAFATENSNEFAESAIQIILFVGMMYSGIHMSKEQFSQPRRRLLFALTLMCLASNIGILFAIR